MKSFSFACLAIQSVFASEDAGRWVYSYGTDPSGKTSTKIIEATGLDWTVYSYSAYDADNGYEYFRLEHELTADIKSTDKVTFELNFLVSQDKWRNKEVMMEDVVICEIVQSTQDTTFWT